MSKLFEVVDSGIRVTFNAERIYSAIDVDSFTRIYDGVAFRDVTVPYDQFVMLWKQALDDERIEVVQEPCSLCGKTGHTWLNCVDIPF
jgi:hypothetical protein